MTEPGEDKAEALARLLHQIQATTPQHAATAARLAEHRDCPIPRTERFWADHLHTIRSYLNVAARLGLVEHRYWDGQHIYWTPTWSKAAQP